GGLCRAKQGRSPLSREAGARRETMSHGDFKARREAVRPILIALNMRPKTGPLQAAEYLQRLAQKERRTLYGKKRGTMFAMPNWTSSALYWALAPLTADE